MTDQQKEELAAIRLRMSEIIEELDSKDSADKVKSAELKKEITALRKKSAGIRKGIKPLPSLDSLFDKELNKIISEG